MMVVPAVGAALGGTMAIAGQRGPSSRSGPRSRTASSTLAGERRPQMRRCHPAADTGPVELEQSARWRPVLVALVLAAGCSGRVAGHGSPDSDSGSTRVFDADALNRDIAAQYGDKFGSNPAFEPNCPPSQPAVKGTSFTCYGRLSTGESQKVEVKVTSNDGDYMWKPVD